MSLVTRKNLKLLWKNFYILIKFTPWKSTLVNYELRTVLQNFNIAVYWFKFFWYALDKHPWIVVLSSISCMYSVIVYSKLIIFPCINLIFVLVMYYNHKSFLYVSYCRHSFCATFIVTCWQVLCPLW